MILTTHALTGAVIGKYIPNPYTVVAVSLVAHYAMDRIRHAEYFDDRIATPRDTWWRIAIDISVGLFFIFSYLHFFKLSFIEMGNIILSAFFSMFPDLLTVIHWKFKNIPILPSIKKFHSWAHNYQKIPKYSPKRKWNLRNAKNDIIISALAILLLFLF